jgi:hypothetical protein
LSDVQARTNPPITSVARGLDPIGAKISACPGRCAAWSIKGVYARLRGLWRNDALQTPISGLPEIGTQICASRVNPTCVDRYTHRLRDGLGPAAHRFAIARAAPHPGHVRPYLSAYGVKQAGDTGNRGICTSLHIGQSDSACASSVIICSMSRNPFVRGDPARCGVRITLSNPSSSSSGRPGSSYSGSRANPPR